MTINDVLTKIKNLKPNQYSDTQQVDWLSQVDMKLYSEYISQYAGMEDVPHGPYDHEDDLSTGLMVPDAYAALYMHYMEAMIDYYNAEYDRFTNSMAMYNTALTTYLDWFNRNNTVKTVNYIKI